MAGWYGIVLLRELAPQSYTDAFSLRLLLYVCALTGHRCTLSVEGPHSFNHNCTPPVVQTDFTPMKGARSQEPGRVCAGVGWGEGG